MKSHAVCTVLHNSEANWKMEAYIVEIRSMVEDGYTHEQISEFLQQHNHGVRGFSARSVRRFALNKIFITAVIYQLRI